MQRITALEHPAESAVARGCARDRAAKAHPDELLTEAEVRATLRRVLSHLPQGSKKSFAKICNYNGRWGLNTMRGVAKGRALLPRACRIRLSQTLNQLLRGEWILVKTGLRTNDGCPSHAWRRREGLSVTENEGQLIEIAAVLSRWRRKDTSVQP